MLLSRLTERQDHSYQRWVTGNQLALCQARSYCLAAPENKGVSVTAGVKTLLTVIAYFEVPHFVRVTRWVTSPDATVCRGK